MGAFMTVIADPVIGGTYMTVRFFTGYSQHMRSTICVPSLTFGFNPVFASFWTHWAILAGHGLDSLFSRQWTTSRFPLARSWMTTMKVCPPNNLFTWSKGILATLYKHADHILLSTLLVFSCASEPGKSRCVALAGQCQTQQDGYYYVSSMCVFIGATLLVLYIAPTIRYLETLNPKLWKLPKDER